MSQLMPNQPVEPAVVDLEERTWLAAHLRGDRQAFAKLMQAYRKPLYSFLVRYGLEAQQRDDLFQEIFLKIHKSAHQYHPNRPLSPWIFTIAVNTLRDWQRKKQQPGVALEIVETIKDEQPSPEQSAHLSETMNWLEQAMIDLPDIQKQAFTLATIQGLKIKEVGTALKLPVNTVKSHIRRAKQQLLSAFQARQEQSGVKSDPSGVTHE